jgi:CMP-N,N'-diacetyllegionaminic acid synthase
MCKCLCIIPARSGSKRIRHKNIKKFDKKPLIFYTISFAQRLKFIDEIVFSSDSDVYLKIAKKYGIKNLSKRRKDLSSEFAKTEDVIKYEIKKIERKTKKKFDKILLLQPTTPFREIKKFIHAHNLIKRKKFDTVITINDVKNYHPHRMKIIKNGILKNYIPSKKINFLPTKKLKKIFIRTGSMYFFKKDNLTKFKSIMGNKIKGIVVKGRNSINIDEQEDLKVAEYYFKKKFN